MKEVFTSPSLVIEGDLGGQKSAVESMAGLLA